MGGKRRRTYSLTRKVFTQSLCILSLSATNRQVRVGPSSSNVLLSAKLLSHTDTRVFKSITCLT